MISRFEHSVYQKNASSDVPNEKEQRACVFLSMKLDWQPIGIGIKRLIKRNVLKSAPLPLSLTERVADAQDPYPILAALAHV